MQDAQQIARDLIQRHGAQAEAVARQRAAELQAGGDVSGYETWSSALMLVRELARTRRESAPPRQSH